MSAPLPPGLIVARSFLSPSMHDNLLTNCLLLSRSCQQQALVAPARDATIPQPMEVRSARHNLRSEERFSPLRIADGDTVLSCEHFARYGEEGHALTYFRGNANIPSFVKQLVIPRVEDSVAPVAQLRAAKAEPLVWKMTLNVYRTTSAEHVAGFPFHVDIPSNGVVTMILSLLSGAHMDLRPLHDDDNSASLCGVHMEASSLVVLSGEARYKWMHRTLPAPSPPGTQPGHVSRVSVVLGCQ